VTPQTNALYYGDNLDDLRRYVKDTASPDSSEELCAHPSFGGAMCRGSCRKLLVWEVCLRR